ncbi:MAG TPA: hypothetical protein VN764_07945, partial [Polyangiaceae bacterium]|nr:hypothetical protein [Polyangiaceae bacterium]
MNSKITHQRDAEGEDGELSSAAPVAMGSTMDGARPRVEDESGFVEVPYEVFLALPKTDLH